MACQTTQRSLAWLRKEGFLPTVVEHYNPYARRKFDLYGFADIVALNPRFNGVLAIQTTTAAHLQERIKKAEKLDAFHLWIKCGNQCLFQGWRKHCGRWEPVNIWYPLEAYIFS